MNLHNMVLMIGMPQVVIIIVVVLLLFGGRKIPELMKGLGSGIKEFKNAAKEEEESKHNRHKLHDFLLHWILYLCRRHFLDHEHSNTH